MKDNVKKNLRFLGFDEEVDRVEKKECPFCGSTKVNREDFRNEISWKEFNQAGMCQKCMDGIFGVD